MPYRIQLASVLTLALTTSATATISLPTIAPVPIPAGTLITDGGGATLDGYLSHDIIINTTSDWTTAALLIELDSGSIYQESEEGFPRNGSTLGQPNPALFGLFPSSEFDTSIFDPHNGSIISGTAGGDVGGDTFQFDTLELDVTWISAGTDTADVGGNTISRVTLSGDAQGRWSFAYTQALSPIVRVVYNPIVNGQMVLSPLLGDLDFDGFVGIGDLNIVLGRWNQPVTPYDLLRGDITGDGLVGIEDLSLILGNWNTGFQPTLPQIPGQLERDYNGDGYVGLEDENIVLSNWNQNVTPGDLSKGDSDGDGFIGISDLAYRNWNAGTPPVWVPPNPASLPPSASAPEPASFVVMCMGLTLVTRRNRNRH